MRDAAITGAAGNRPNGCYNRDGPESKPNWGGRDIAMISAEIDDR
jgi:hypothetical protein